MVVGCSGWWRGRNTGGGEDRCAVPAGRIGGDCGQSLIIVVLAMTLVVALAAFSIDVGQWYVNRHHTQVSADAAALAAANCLASTKCTQTTANGDAAGAADDIANQNGFQTSNVTVTFPTSATVKVTLKNSASSAFAGLFGISSVNTTQSATASYYTLPAVNFSCPSTGATNCLSMFAGNSYCPAKNPPAHPVGLEWESNGGGDADVNGAYSNGFFNNNANSNHTWNVTGVSCSSDQFDKKNTNYTPTTTVLPYPAVWTQPTCDSAHTASGWSTSAITAGGTYCVKAPPSTCADGGSGAGYINIDLGKLPSGEYEFVGPCVVLSGARGSGVTTYPGQPLVYGTSNITTYATTASLPTCVANDGSNGTTTWLDGNNVALDAPIYDQCGTVEITGNKTDFVGFIEAWNILSDKNSGVTGNGPTSPSGGGETTNPGGDALTN